jgi:hypothetical protein
VFAGYGARDAGSSSGFNTNDLALFASAMEILKQISVEKIV